MHYAKCVPLTPSSRETSPTHCPS